MILSERNMKITVFKHEWKIMRRRYSTWLLLGLLFSALLSGWFNGHSHAAALKQKIERIVGEQEEQYATLKNSFLEGSTEELKAAESPGKYGGLHSLTLPVQPLAALTVGQSDISPQIIGVGVMNKQRLPQDRYGYENPIHLLNGAFDVAFVIIVLVPLIIIAMSYDIIADERERGILPLLLAAPVSMPQLLIGKIVLRFILVAGTCLLTLLISMIFSGQGPSISLPMFWTWMIFTIAYILFWFALAAFVNIGRSSSVRNAIRLSMAWLAFVVIFPALVHVLIEMVHPVTPRLKAVNAAREKPMEYYAEKPRLAEQWYQRFPELKTEAQNAVTVKESFGAAFWLLQEEMDRRAAPVDKQIESEIARQQELLRFLSLISPSIALREAFNLISGTDVSRYQSFRKQAELFRLEWRKFFLPRAIHAHKMTPKDYMIIPVFDFKEAAGKSILFQLGLNIIGIGLLTLLVVLKVRHKQTDTSNMLV